MKNRNVFIFLTLLFCSFSTNNFKQNQLKYPRVRAAYAEKGKEVSTLLKNKNIRSSQLQLYIRAFKKEKEMELWGKNQSDQKYQLIKKYAICKTSGKLGPKRRQGDLQIPEGFYHIDRFNPSSSYHLSLGINYPNKSDKILG